MQSDTDSLILAIDTSCDDTSAAVIRNGRSILSSIVYGQGEIHSLYGGVVPEAASRRHTEMIWPTVKLAMEQSNTEFSQLSAIAVCCGPGLIGCLIVGTSFAKAMAYALNLPLIGVNHLEGHICSVFLTHEPVFPHISLVVSGGHTSLYLVRAMGAYEEIGRTRDDAAGEAYDKVAKMLGLDYPGGPLIDKLARIGNPKAVNFPRSLIKGTLDFSFSGLKTSVRNHLLHNSNISTEDICASFQAAVTDTIITKLLWAAEIHGINTLTISGGVAANERLRERLLSLKNMRILMPPKEHCTDNAAMIGLVGDYYFRQGASSDLTLNPKAYLPINQ
ncbi:MAG: tRNA (adenosine(37)-N6)-threonylcarbamoyltransferase complex transferase subunit TsaD [Nitrospirae bacterium]|nr:tRNA (adenosine(37)-N6)-threonylcarbamoyltransferase complex transferase subunit TsaD [Nitrospirota bacterium]MBF0533808.1 tRNA (adenosine(37)-N6)-threonylcarbamoyltransferase complex transferase subunit TsaD [Nitrospirota bacterium]MBF0615483.1 tRNA (adenosine(37)-N6)-threonylcarbamoyltransferase complex transferase subunit TsaD [Nitrospirota bacterium]